MKRDPHSHKTQNGTVAVVGGSPLWHGAPIFSALAAEASGVDLIYPFVHERHEIVTRAASLNFIVQAFKRESLTISDAARILLLLREVHVGILGPGMAETKENERALMTIVKNAACPLVLDARALRPAIVKHIRSGSVAILTPHLGELEHLTGRNLSHATQREIRVTATVIAKKYGAIVLLKGHEDFIIDPKGRREIVKGGNAGLTKGGTGDALAGLIAGLIAQSIEPFEACVMAARVIKRAATVLFPEKGYGYTTGEVIAKFPHLLNTY